MAQSPTKITFVINSLEGGGAERMLCKLLEVMQSAFVQQAWQVKLVLLDNQVEMQSCPKYVEKHTLNSQGSLLKSYLNLRRFLQQHPTDILISFLTRSNYISCLLGRQLSIPCVISERVNTSEHFGNGIKASISKLLVRTLYPMATKILAVSEGVKDDLASNFNLTESNIEVMHNAYDISHLQQLAQRQPQDLTNKPYIVAIGRLVANKNFSLLISAFAQSDTRRDLVILGQGPEQDHLLQLAENLGISDRVHFAGFQTNPYPFIQDADYLVSTSNAEGFPNAIAEALCFGKPVISTNCPSGPAEILADDWKLTVQTFKLAKFGILCQTNNQDAVAAAINAIEQPAIYSRYRAASEQRRYDFSSDKLRLRFIKALNQSSQEGLKLEPSNV